MHNKFSNTSGGTIRRTNCPPGDNVSCRRESPGVLGYVVRADNF